MSDQIRSSIYHERDIFLNLSSCSIFLLCELTTLGDTVIDCLVESKEQMKLFFELMETVLTSSNNLNDSSPSFQITYSKNLILSILCVLCNILSNSKGRKWFVQNSVDCLILNHLIDLKLNISENSFEDKILVNIFKNLRPCFDELNLDKSKLNTLQTFVE